MNINARIISIFFLQNVHFRLNLLRTTTFSAFHLEEMVCSMHFHIFQVEFSAAGTSPLWMTGTLWRKNIIFCFESKDITLKLAHICAHCARATRTHLIILLPNWSCDFVVKKTAKLINSWEKHNMSACVYVLEHHVMISHSHCWKHTDQRTVNRVNLCDCNQFNTSWQRVFFWKINALIYRVASILSRIETCSPLWTKEGWSVFLQSKLKLNDNNEEWGKKY